MSAGFAAALTVVWNQVVSSGVFVLAVVWKAIAPAGMLLR